mmetsp:Transcript_24251/g.79054  ORF Transcript_24251/g.79054 Transcript_24251/m.79054 type:complete len:340 (+) Transcript_24251:1432-2451(+)
MVPAHLGARAPRDYARRCSRRCGRLQRRPRLRRAKRHRNGRPGGFRGGCVAQGQGCRRRREAAHGAAHGEQAQGGYASGEAGVPRSRGFAMASRHERRCGAAHEQPPGREPNLGLSGGRRLDWPLGSGHHQQRARREPCRGARRGLPPLQHRPRAFLRAPTVNGQVCLRPRLRSALWHHRRRRARDGCVRHARPVRDGGWRRARVQLDRRRPRSAAAAWRERLSPRPRHLFGPAPAGPRRGARLYARAPPGALVRGPAHRHRYPRSPRQRPLQDGRRHHRDYDHRARLSAPALPHNLAREQRRDFRRDDAARPPRPRFVDGPDRALDGARRLPRRAPRR